MQPGKNGIDPAGVEIAISTGEQFPIIHASHFSKATRAGLAP
jgi:hypothetical protein